MKKALVIHPKDIADLGNLLAIARSEGKKALDQEKVRVDPHVLKDDEGNFIVEVEPHNTSGAGVQRQGG